MKQVFYLLTSLLLATSLAGHAQNNYLATTTNSSTPGMENTFVGPAAGAGGISTTTGGFNTFLGTSFGV